MFKKLLLAVVGVAIIAGVGFAADPQAPTMPFYWVNGVVKNPEKLGGRDLYVYAQNYGTGYLRVAVDTVTGAFRFNVYELKYYHNNDNWMEVGGKPVFIMSVVRKWGGADPLNYGTSEISSVNWAKGYIDADLELVLNGGPNDFSGGQIAGFVSDEATKQMIGGAGLAETPVGAKATTANDGTYMFADTFDTNSVHNVAASATGYDSNTVTGLTIKPTKVSWAGFALKSGGGTDNGLIRNTQILRVGSTIRLTWEYDPALADKRADIWRLSGNKLEYSTAADWGVAPVAAALSGLQYDDALVAGDGNNGYYRVVPVNTVKADIFKPENNAVTVSKVDVTVPKNGEMQLLGLPVQGGKVSSVFLGQVASGQEFILLPKSGSGLDYVSVNSATVVGNDFVVDPTVGFWLRNPNTVDKTFTFVGRMPFAQYMVNLAAFDLTGNPLAKSFASGNLGLAGDIIMPQAGNGLDYYVRDGAGWGSSFPTLKLNAGFWYKSTGNRRWSVTPSSQNAIIEQY